MLVLQGCWAWITWDLGGTCWPRLETGSCLVSHFHFGSGGTIWGLLLTISNFGAIYIQSTLRHTQQWIRFSPRKAPLSQTSSSCLSGNRCLLISELRAVGRQSPELFLSPPGWRSHSAMQRTGHAVRSESWSLAAREAVPRGNAMRKGEWLMWNARLKSISPSPAPRSLLK